MQVGGIAMDEASQLIPLFNQDYFIRSTILNVSTSIKTDILLISAQS